MKILINEKEIVEIVKNLAKAINRDYQGKKVLLVGILKGSIVFMSDLMRQLEMETEIDFVALSSYQGTETTGKVKLVKDLTTDIKDKNVLIVEDIVDTGLSLDFLTEVLKGRQPESLKIVTFLDKPSRRKVDFKADYVGKDIPDYFVVGYGLDCDERYRNLPYVGIYEETNNY